MASDEAYHHQLQLINQMLEQTAEGPERDELNNLRENIEELMSLTNTDANDVSNIEKSEDDGKPDTRQDMEMSNFASGSKKPHEFTIEDEYALFMAEMTKEGAIESNNGNIEDEAQEGSSKSDLSKQLKDLEGKKFRAPHKHQWGQLAYHNAMVCSVPEDVSNIEELMVKILFLNPTHKEMLPCPYYFDLEKDCRFSEDTCRFSHGELVQYSSLQEYIEPKFEKLTKGSEVLAKQSDNLWYRGKISQISKGKCLVKFQSKNVENEDYENIIFEHILPLNSENDSEDAASDEEGINTDDESNEILEAQKQQEELINRSLMITPESIPLGDWEKHTKGIGSKLMQKMGYIVGTGLGKLGDGIVKPVTALVLPQGKSLDFCMNLKERARDPNLFNADKMPKLKKNRREKPSKVAKRKRIELKLKDMTLEELIVWYFGRGMEPLKTDETQLLREKLKVATTKEVNLSNFKISEKLKKLTRDLEKVTASIRRLEGKLKTNGALFKRQTRVEVTLKRLNIFQLVVSSELDRRKNNKEMAVF